MKSIDRKVSQYINDSKESVNRDRVRDTILASKNAFSLHENEQTINYFEFLYQQSQYIQKQWWFFQGGLLIFLWLVLEYSDSSLYVQRCMGLTAPLFGLLILPETWKNRKYASMEIEGAALYTLRQIYSARILLFALVDLLFLSVFWFTAAKTGILSGSSFIVNFFLPFIVTCCIIFRSMCSRLINSEYLTLLICMCWESIWMMIIYNERFYQAVNQVVWIGLLILAILYLLYCIYRSQKYCDKIWEVNSEWN